MQELDLVVPHLGKFRSLSVCMMGESGIKLEAYFTNFGHTICMQTGITFTEVDAYSQFLQIVLANAKTSSTWHTLTIPLYNNADDNDLRSKLTIDLVHEYGFNYVRCDSGKYAHRDRHQSKNLVFYKAALETINPILF